MRGYTNNPQRYNNTNQVRESKIELMFRMYKLFEMKASESITKLYKRFSNLVNDWKELENKFKTIKPLRKFLRILPKT